MQPYRQIKPHVPDECVTCIPTSPGHQLCQHDGCDELAEIQHRRHASEAEYDELPEAFKPIDGVAHRIVFTCLDHEVDPICGPGHHAAEPEQAPDDTTARCPRCGASAGRPCTKANGRPRSAVHDARVQATTTAPAPRCDHVHREDCGGQAACSCTADDPAPVRQPRVIPPPAPPAPAPIHVPTHGAPAEFLAENGIDPMHVLSLELLPSVAGPVVLRGVVALVDHLGNYRFDEHGQRLAEVREISLTPTHPTDPVRELPCRNVPASTAEAFTEIPADVTPANPSTTE